MGDLPRRPPGAHAEEADDDRGGAGDRYACRPCDFDLHVECALAETVMAHPLFKDAQFRLQELLRPGAGHDDDNAGSGSGSGSILCVACGGEVLGLHYHCAANARKKKGYLGLDIHPWCAALPREIRREELTLELRKEAFHSCDSCPSRRDIGGWFYRSTCKTVYLHVACVKGIMIADGGGGGSSGSTDPLAAVKEAALRIYRAKKDEEGEVERVILGLILGG